jgi:hypothetical protein
VVECLSEKIVTQGDSWSELRVLVLQLLELSDVSQSGSQTILKTEDPTHQRISVPNRRNFRVGTLNALLCMVQANKSVSKEEIYKLS